jgi:hypothetical protein
VGLHLHQFDAKSTSLGFHKSGLAHHFLVIAPFDGRGVVASLFKAVQVH